MAKRMAHRTSNRKLKPEVVLLVTDCLRKDWSPKQISGWLERNFFLKVSHETIYQIIRNDASGELARHCRHKMKYRHHRVKRTAKNIPDRVSIHERPKEADGSRFGDWEMDTIVGSGNKGAIENANKLIRQYIPKEMDLDSVSDRKLAFFVAKINDRPREKLDSDSPKSRFFKFFN